jgi:Acyl-CoA synthetases (AMP-forming)/AMP-acid ligases II
MLILEAIRKHAVESPNKIAFIDGNIEITYKELWIRILKVSIFFKSKLGKGDRVILASSKNLDFVYLYFGLQLAGLIAVPVDPEISDERLSKIIYSAKPKGLYGLLRSDLCETFAFPEIDNILIKDNNVDFPDENDIADIIYTTGTTGEPKGVVLTHKNELSAANNINSFINNKEDDIEILVLPISHSFGLGRLRCVMLKGGTIIMSGGFANLKKFYAELDKHNIVGFGMVPAGWRYLFQMSGKKIAKYANQLKYLEIGSAFMPIEDKKLLMDLLPNTRICMHYGLTEASRSTFISFRDEEGHLNSIGKEIGGSKIKIFDENGKECNCGEEGELCVKGSHVCDAYWNDMDKYLESFYGEYFRTGDWAYKDDKGYIYLISRKKN